MNKKLYVTPLNDLPHDKTNKMTVRPVKTPLSLGICQVWSESSLSAWRKLGSWATHWTHSKDSDQTGQMLRLIWVFAGRTPTFLVLSWGGSNCFRAQDVFFREISVSFSIGVRSVRCLIRLEATAQASRQERSREWVWLRIKVSLVGAPVRPHTFVEIYHELLSVVILPFLLIQEGQMSVSGESMCTVSTG